MGIKETETQPTIDMNYRALLKKYMQDRDDFEEGTDLWEYIIGHYESNEIAILFHIKDELRTEAEEEREDIGLCSTSETTLVFHWVDMEPASSSKPICVAYPPPPISPRTGTATARSIYDFPGQRKEKVVELKSLPEDYEEQDAGISNFDHSIDRGCEGGLRAGKNFCQHSAWDFCGYIWYDPEDELFYEVIGRHKKHVDTLSAKTLKELMERANSKHGCE